MAGPSILTFRGRSAPSMTSAFHPLRTSAGSAEQTRPLSEIDLFGELQGVINFDAEVADSAFEFTVTKK